MPRNSIRLLAILCLLAPSAFAKPLEIVIHHRYGEAPLLMESARYESAAKETFSFTAPHMHDGRFATIEEVVAHYNAGVTRSPNFDPNLAKDPDTGLGLWDADQAALVAFLKTLTDTTRKPSR